jgi:signal transduction histidine kinase
MASRPSAAAARRALLFGLLFMGGVVVLLSAIYLSVTRAIDHATDQQIEEELDTLSAIDVREGPAALIAEIEARRMRAHGAGAIYMLVDSRNARLAGGLETWPFGRQARGPEYFTVFEPGGSADLPYPARGAVRALQDGRALLVGRDLTLRTRFGSVFLLANVIAVVAVALLAVAAGYSFSRRVTRRIEAAATVCESIVAGNLSQRLPVTRANDELDILSGEVNWTLGRLEEVTRNRRAVFDAAAHDLRAPLQRLRNRIEILRRTALRDAGPSGLDEALRDIDGMQQTLVTLLEIARAESGTPLADASQFDLVAMLRGLFELFGPLAEQERLDLRLDVQGPVPVYGNRQLIAQLTSNLIENAIKYVPADGSIVVAASRNPQGARLVVADNGLGIPVEKRMRALEPFARLDTSVGEGSGLGLALVAAVARLHSAKLTLDDNNPGLRVTVDFPEAPAEAVAAA